MTSLFSSNPIELKDKRLDEALVIIQHYKMFPRIVQINGVSFMATQEYRTDRVSLRIQQLPPATDSVPSHDCHPELFRVVGFGIG